MELPVISTNWSGIAEFLNEGNGYPIAVESLDPVVGAPACASICDMHALAC